MNFDTSVHCERNKENIAPSKTDASQVQQDRQRVVFGALSGNEQCGQSFGQGSQLSKHSDSSQLIFISCLASSSHDMHVEEAREVVLAASGQEVVSDSCHPVAKPSALQNANFKLLLELSSSSCQDSSMQSEPDIPLTSEVAPCAFQYAEEIHRHLRESEMKFRPKPDYLQKHPEITSDMRVILVDWIVEVVQGYRLRTETLHLAVNYLDRFLSRTAFVKRNKLQLVGTAALLIAAKYEEISPPEVKDFVYMTDNTYTKKMLLQMELFFLRVLAFQMAAPTTHQFLHLFMSIHAVCAYTGNLALYVAELSLLEMNISLQYTPSIVAAGAYCLAGYTVNKSLWPFSLYVFTGYTMDEIVPCLTDLHKLYIAAESCREQNIREKYKSSKYCKVSWITPPPILPFP